jgi:hypothetical protein
LALPIRVFLFGFPKPLSILNLRHESELVDLEIPPYVGAVVVKVLKVKLIKQQLSMNMMIPFQ